MINIKCLACGASLAKHVLYAPAYTKKINCPKCGAKLFWVSSVYARLIMYVLMGLIPLLVMQFLKYYKRHQIIDFSEMLHPILIESVVFSGLVILLLLVSFWIVLRVFPGRLSLNFQ